jgi:RNA exonuclease 4
VVVDELELGIRFCQSGKLVSDLRLHIASSGNPVADGPFRCSLHSLAIDCEMVGLGHLGAESCLARVSIVNYHGHVILDEFVRPRERVTDWRTWVSGVRPEDMESAREFMDVQRDVAKLVEGRILIGHAIQNDTQVSRRGELVPWLL